MMEKEIFNKLRQQKNKLGLKMRYMLSVTTVVFGSIIISYLILLLLHWLFPMLKNGPLVLELVFIGSLISFFVSRFFANRFYKPINELRTGMQRVSEGKFDVRLENKFPSKELQEVITGFNMMAKELQSTEILQSDFVSNVSHEFKTPINAIEGYATLLQNTEGIDDTENEYIEKILFNTRRISSLVSNVLLLSKIENQSLQLHAETYDLAEQVREEIVALEPAWSKKDIEFDVELTDIKYLGYKNLMHHVFGNLIGNAIKFSESGGRIKIALKRTEGALVFSVDDEGPGISEDTKKHIFDKFYQADTSHKVDGNGLGLALVSRILGVVGGTVSAENKEGRGCVFTVTLPIEKTRA